jgi:hypothetical protein
MKPTGQLVEFADTEELRAMIALFLTTEGQILGTRDISTEFAIYTEMARRAMAGRELADRIIEILIHRGVKALDLDVQAAGQRLQDSRRA